jgi:hypothetical protein
MKIIPSKIHTYIGLVVGVVLIAAPWIFGFDDESTPKWTAVVIGLFLLVNELVTTSPSSPVKVVPMKAHIAIEVVTGIVLAVSPWLFGFADLDSKAWVPHLVVGILVVGYALITDPRDADARGEVAPEAQRGRTASTRSGPAR